MTEAITFATETMTVGGAFVGMTEIASEQDFLQKELTFFGIGLNDEIICWESELCVKKPANSSTKLIKR